jgi:hypothetical protein
MRTSGWLVGVLSVVGMAFRAVRCSTDMEALKHCVMGVLSAGTEEEMVESDASFVVAVVAHTHPIGNRAVSLLPSEPGLLDGLARPAAYVDPWVWRAGTPGGFDAGTEV